MLYKCCQEKVRKNKKIKSEKIKDARVKIHLDVPCTLVHHHHQLPPRGGHVVPFLRGVHRGQPNFSKIFHQTRPTRVPQRATVDLSAGGIGNAINVAVRQGISVGQMFQGQGWKTPGGLGIDQ